MNKKFLVVISILFLPITLLFFIVKFFIKLIENKRIKSFLNGITINDIDAITGYQFEEIVAYLFNYFRFKAKTTKRSGDYGVDIFATKNNIKYCIQTKLYFGHKVGSSAVQEINTGKNYFNCDYAIIMTNSFYSKQALDMSDKLGIILFDRNDVAKLLLNYKNNNKRYLKKLMEVKINGRNSTHFITRAY
ncbi:MAG: restriction endonuclease [Clostridia bacterium]|nr:restriction endonuclease [Clostridia bacterium]